MSYYKNMILNKVMIIIHQERNSEGPQASDENK